MLIFGELFFINYAVMFEGIMLVIIEEDEVYH